VLNPWRSQEELEGVFLGHRVYLKAKARGEKSMPEKRGSLEDTKGAAPQDPRDKAKAGLPEPQSPAVKCAHPPLRCLYRGATGGRPFNFRGPPPSTGKAMANEAIEGDEWGAYVMLDTFSITGTWDRLPGASPKATESP
jgi:hypothetical protein